jgi:hypothetical protein
MALATVAAVLKWIHTALNTSPLACSDHAMVEELRAELSLDRGYCNFNHGSFGVCPTPLLQRKQLLLLQAEARPDMWYRVRGSTIVT